MQIFNQIATQTLVADTTTFAADTTAATSLGVADTLSGPTFVGVEELFGSGVRMSQGVAGEHIGSFLLTDNGVVGALLLALFVFYLFVVVTYGGYLGHMWKIIVGDNLGIRVADELSYLYMRAVRRGVAVGVVAWSLVAIKWLEIGTHPPFAEVDNLWLVPLAIVAALAIGLIQRLLTVGICNLTRRRDVAEGLNILADTTMAFAAFVATPAVLLFVANVGSSTIWIGWIATAVASLALITFCIKSLIFFSEQKISILLWFLYLCTAILIPIGTVATLVARNCAV